MQIVQISDCHLFADRQKTGYNDINPYLSLQKVLQEVSAYPLDLLLVTGDISGDASAESYQHFQTLFIESTLNCELQILPGNHDSEEYLLDTFSKQNLWLSSPLQDRHKNWQIHLLNTQFKGTLGKVSAQDLVALQEQLQTNSDKYHFIAVHHHPIDCEGWMNKHEWLNRDEFTELIESFAVVKVVVYGHIHTEIETKQNGVLYLACPSTCWQWSNSATFGVAELLPGFRIINLHENGEISHSIKHITQV